MLIQDRIKQIQEERAKRFGSDVATYPTNNFTDNIERIRQERADRLAAVAQAEFAPQSSATDTAQKKNLEPDKNVSWWEKTKAFLEKYPSPLDFVKEKVAPAASTLVNKSPLVQAVKTKSLEPYKKILVGTPEGRAKAEEEFQRKKLAGEININKPLSSEQAMNVISQIPMAGLTSSIGSTVVGNLAKTKTVEGVKKLLGKEVANYSDDVIQKLAQETDVAKVSSLLKNKVISPEEFVKVQESKPNILFRGERTGKGMGKGASVMGKGLYLSPNKESALYYADNVAENVKGYEVVGNPKLLEKNSVEFGSIHDKAMVKAKKTDWDYERVIGEDVQKAGYDGVKDTEGKKIVIYQPENFLKEIPLKSQLTDMKKAKAGTRTLASENPLLQEAGKYETLEEFVKAQGTPVYHGSKNEIKVFGDVPESGTRFLGKGVYFTDDISRAKEFGKVNEAVINLKNPYKQGDEFNEVLKAEIRKLYGKKEAAIAEKIIQRKEPLKATEINSDLITKLYQKAGYDGVISTGGAFGAGKGDILVFEPSQIKTKSQLTDLWKKAQGEDVAKANRQLQYLDTAKKEKAVSNIPEPTIQKEATTFPEAKNLTPKEKNILDTGIRNAVKKDAKVKEQLRTAQKITKTDGSVKESMKNWLRNTFVGRAEAQKASLDFKISENPANLAKHEAGVAYEGRDAVTAKFDELFKKAEDAGIKLEKRANYIPHVYAQSPEQIKKAVAKAMAEKGVDKAVIDGYLNGEQISSELARSLKMQPSFSIERAFGTYKEAATYGLTPKYDTMRQLVAHYTEKLNDIIANKKLIDDLIESKKLTSQSHSGLMAVNIPGNEGNYFAEPKIAGYLNDYFRNESALNIQQKIFKVGAKLSQGLQTMILSGGVPKTNANFYVAGYIDKELKTAIGSLATLDIRRAITHLKIIPNFIQSNFTRLAIRRFNTWSENGMMLRAAGQGIDMSKVMGNYKEVNRGFLKFFQKTEGKKLAGEGFDRLISEKSFNSVIPMQTMTVFEDTYKSGIRRGLSEEAASKLAGDTTKNYQGLIDNLRGKSAEELLTTVFFAPRFREGLIHAYWNTLKSLSPHTWSDKSFSENRKLAIGSAIVGYFGYEWLNKKLTGHSMMDNPSGKKTELMIPGKDGKVYYVPFAPSQLAFFRNIIEAGTAAVVGDTKTAVQKAGSNLSIGFKLATDVIGNRDYFGNEIYDTQAPMSEQVADIAKYIGQNANHPYVKGVWNMMLNANAEKQKIYPTYQKISKLFDQGKRDEANLIIDSLSPEDKQAYNEMRKQKLKPFAQVMSEMAEVPLRFTTQGKIASQQYYQKIDDIARAVKTIPEGQERTDKLQELIAQSPENERRGILNAMSDAGISTTGVSISEDIIRLKPTFNKVRELIANGDKAGAQKIIDSLSDKDVEAFKKVRSAFLARKTKQEKEDMQPLFDQVRELVRAGKKDEAQKIIDGLTDRQVEVFKLLKNSNL